MHDSRPYFNMIGFDNNKLYVEHILFTQDPQFHVFGIQEDDHEIISYDEFCRFSEYLTREEYMITFLDIDIFDFEKAKSYSRFAICLNRMYQLAYENANNGSLDDWYELLQKRQEAKEEFDFSIIKTHPSYALFKPILFDPLDVLPLKLRGEMAFDYSPRPNLTLVRSID
jgi:hypothetical protein